LSNWLVRIAALCDPAIKLILPELGQFKNATNEKATRLLGWKPRSREEAVVATAESLVRLGLVRLEAYRRVAEPASARYAASNDPIYG
jgi:dihydroflavonol-4-reductase